tara:strand:+ start:169 stop:639 length:471 start_codon:yes stop_codon:yes gene_type:complete
MKNRFLTLTISAILGTAVVYALMKLESFINRSNNPEYADMVGELAEFAIPDLGLVLLFFVVVYPYQFIVRTLQQQLERCGFSIIGTSLMIIGISTLLYSIGFAVVFRSPHLGTSDTIQTFGLGTLIFGTYYLSNLSTYHLLSNIGTDRNVESLDNA